MLRKHHVLYRLETCSRRVYLRLLNFTITIELKKTDSKQLRIICRKPEDTAAILVYYTEILGTKDTHIGQEARGGLPT